MKRTNLSLSLVAIGLLCVAWVLFIYLAAAPKLAPAPAVPNINLGKLLVGLVMLVSAGVSFLLIVIAFATSGWKNRGVQFAAGLWFVSIIFFYVYIETSRQRAIEQKRIRQDKIRQIRQKVTLAIPFTTKPAVTIRLIDIQHQSHASESKPEPVC